MLSNLKRYLVVRLDKSNIEPTKLMQDYNSLQKKVKILTKTAVNQKEIMLICCILHCYFNINRA